MTSRDKHDERFFNELKEYASLYPTVITRLRKAADAGEPHVTKAIDVFATVSRLAECGKIARCRTRFDLTTTQARLALLLVEGATINQCANAMGIKVSTARTHLKSVFTKTGTKRQAELAILILNHR
jgi:DNA-binding CsgD family transcriptional regulator